MKKIWMVLVLAGLFVVVGCTSQEAQLATSPAEINGIYQVNPGHSYMRIEMDGILVAGPSLSLVNEPVMAPDSYRFEGDQLFIENVDNVLCEAMTAIYRVQLLEDGRLRFLAVDDGCEHRKNVFQGLLDADTGQPNNVWTPVE
ncbi:MAG: hypothetical protein PVI99_02360 [Anaerolineales bacterium]|jgi:hypothetical protein